MVPVPLTQPGLVLQESEQGWGIPAAASPNPRPRPLSPGLLLHDVTMAGLQELRFPEEKPLLRGQDVAELVSRPVTVLGRRAPPRGKQGSCVPRARNPRATSRSPVLAMGASPARLSTHATNTQTTSPRVWLSLRMGGSLEELPA